MKVKVTKKQIQQNFRHVISVPLPSPYFLLAWDAQYYTAGVYGWNADVYAFPAYSTAIVAGYRPFGKAVSYTDMAYWESEAEKIVASLPEGESPKGELCHKKMVKHVYMFIQANKD